MKRLSARERVLATICLLLLFSVLLLQLVAKPLRQQLAEANDLLQMQQDFINRAQADALTLYSLETEVVMLTKGIKPYLICDDIVPTMIRKAEEAATEAGLEKMDIRPLGSENLGNIDRHRMQLDLLTNFPKLKDFIYYLESGKGGLSLDRVDINSDKSINDAVRATVAVSAYSPPGGGENEK